ncbi:signal peptidase I [Mycoplasmatota bacterium]|nr:signal peptidase I [Mycoplasmatota bacterium]
MSENKNKKIYSLIKMILFYVLVFFLSMFVIFEVFMPKQTVKVFGFKPYNVITQSMEPVLKVNDLIIVKNFDVEDLEEEDIITFYADIDYNGEKEIVTHYIYSIDMNDSDEYIIRTNRHFDEDNNIVPDTWILNEDDVLGLYSFKIPYLGYVTEFFKSPFGIAAIVVNAGIIAAIVILIKREKKMKMKEDEQIE